MTSNAAIRVSDLSLAIGGAKIVDGVTLEVAPGELLELLVQMVRAKQVCLI